MSKTFKLFSKTILEDDTTTKIKNSSIHKYLLKKVISNSHNLPTVTLVLGSRSSVGEVWEALKPALLLNSCNSICSIEVGLTDWALETDVY